MNTQFYNSDPNVDLPDTYRHYHQSFAYNVSGLAYDPSGNILSLQRYDETASLIDSLAYSYTGNRLTRLEDGITDSTATSTQVTTTEEPVFEESLVEPWMNASWNVTVDYTSTDYAWEGTTSIRVDSDNWGALSVHYDSWGSPAVIEAGVYERVRLMIYPPDSALTMRLGLQNDAGQSFTNVSLGTIPVGQWTTVDVPLSQLNPNGYDWERINLMEDSNAPRTFYVDHFRLSASDTTEVLAGWDAETADFGYDGNGNLISQTGKFSSIKYDHRNLPVKFTMSDGSKLLAGYNAEGQRILKQLVGGSYQFYIQDGPQTLAVIADDTLQYVNLFGNALFGRIIAMNGNLDITNARRYYLTDHLGSTRAVVDNNGNVLETFDYYPFGLLMPGRSGGTNTTLEKFTGHELDSEANLNLLYAGARYLDPALGRWTSSDPLDEYASPYVYVGNNPISFNDPTGMFSNLAVRPDGKGGIIIEEGDTFNDVLEFFDYDWEQARLIWSQTRARGGTSVGDGGNEVVTNETRFSRFDLAVVNLQRGLSLADAILPQKKAGAIFAKGFFFLSVSQKLRRIQNILGLSRNQLLSLVKNKALRNTIEELFRLTDDVPGGTAGAIRQELKTGKAVGGKSKVAFKGPERIANLQNILKNENLSPVERDVAKALLLDLKQAMKGR